MHRSILIVDDESGVRRLVRGILSSAGYQDLTEAEDGLAAYDLIRGLKTELKLVITDIRMPRMNGAELTERLREEYPNIKILCISGYTDPLSPNGHYFLAKPFKPTALLAIVQKVFEIPTHKESPIPDEGRETTSAGEGHRIEPDLRARMFDADEKLQAAYEEYRRQMAVFADLDVNADGLMVLRQTMAVQQDAFTEYNKAWREWIEFLESRYRQSKHIRNTHA